MPEFAYQDPFPVAPDSTRYRPITSDYVSTATFEGQEILKVAPEALTALAREAFRDVSFLYRTSHLEKVAAILDDPEASANDRGVATGAAEERRRSPPTFDCRCARIPARPRSSPRRASASGPARKDEEWLARGIYETYQKENLRYSQTVPLTMYRGDQLRDESAGTDRYLRRWWG